MIEDENSDLAKDNAKKKFGSLDMMVGELAREYVARAKDLASEVRYHQV